MTYAFMSLFAAFIVAADQISKYFVSHHMALYESRTLIPGVVELYYVRNSGMAWSLLSGARWFFVGITVALLALLVVVIWKKMFTKKFELFCLAAIIGGAIGNFIDRLFYGEVIDMINVTFIDFPVFNVADCFVTCGAILLVVYILIFDRKDKRNDSAK